MKITRQKLLTLLKENKFVKTEVAEALQIDEASVRRLCKKHKIDTKMERTAGVTNTKHTQYKSVKKSNASKANEGSFVIVPDLHAHEVIWEYLATVCDFIREFKPKVLIQLGDLMDYECLLGMQKRKYPSFDGKDLGSLETEFQASAKILTMLNAAAPKGCRKVFLKGNHEWRADDLIKKFPEFKNLFDIEKRLDFTGWEVHAYLKKVKIGKLNVIHGEFFGQNPVMKHLTTYQKNIVFGHTHAIGQATLPSPMREIPIWGAMLGCLTNLNAAYMRNHSSRAEHGFGYGWWDEKSGDFDCKIARIIHGNFWANGKRYTTNVKRTKNSTG